MGKPLQNLLSPAAAAAAAEEHEQFTCEICTQPSLTSDEKFTNCTAVPCSHPFCNNCMIKYISSRLEDNVGDIDCPDLNCTNKLDPLACAAIVGAPQLVRWCDVLCEAAIAGLDKSYCPYGDCNVLIVNECGGNVGKLSCPKCKRLLCFMCSEVWHEGYGCSQFRVRIRDENDRAFDRIAKERNWQRCPSCGRFVEWVSGCNIISCRCRTKFCYKCGDRTDGEWCSQCGNPVLILMCLGRCCFLLIIVAICICFIVFLFSFFLSLRVSPTKLSEALR